MSSTRRTLGLDSVATLSFTAVSAVLGIVAGVLVARWLGPEGKGVYSSLGLLQSGVGAFTGGIGASITYLLTKRSRTLSELSLPLLALLGLTSLLTWVGLIAWGLTRGFGTTSLIFFLSVPAATVVSWQGYLFLGLGRVRTFNAVTLARGLLLLVLLFVWVRLLNGGVTGALLAWSAAIYAAAVYVVGYTMRRRSSKSSARLWEDLKDLLRFGARSSLDGMLGFLTYRLDSLLIIGFLGVAGYGVYSVAVSGGEVLFMISRSVAASAAHRIGSSELAESARVTAKAVRTTVAVVGIAAAAVFVAAPLLVNLLYGGRFAAAVLPLRIMLPGVVAFAPASIFAAFFSYQLGRPMFGVYLTLALLFIEVIGCLSLIPRFGLAGAAAASTITYLASTIGETWYFRKVTALSPLTLWMITKNDLGEMLHMISRAAKA